MSVIVCLETHKEKQVNIQAGSHYKRAPLERPVPVQEQRLSKDPGARLLVPREDKICVCSIKITKLALLQITIHTVPPIKNPYQ